MGIIKVVVDEVAKFGTYLRIPDATWFLKCKLYSCIHTKKIQFLLYVARSFD